MTHEADLLRAVLARPDDDTPRLAYADWLDDRGQSGDAERAEFIQVQVGLARESFIEACRLEPFATPPSRYGTHAGSGHCPGCDLAARELELFAAAGQWQHEWMGPVHALTVCGIEWSAYLCWFARGFVERVKCSAAEWLTHADAMLAAHPVRRVHLTTLPEYRFNAEGRTHFLGRDGTHWIPRGEGYDHSQRGIAAVLLGLEWPGVEFEMPAAPPATFDTVRRAMVDTILRRFALPAALTR